MRARAAEKASASGAGNVEKAQPSLERGSGFDPWAICRWGQTFRHWSHNCAGGLGDFSVLF